MPSVPHIPSMAWPLLLLLVVLVTFLLDFYVMSSIMSREEKDDVIFFSKDVLVYIPHYNHLVPFIFPLDYFVSAFF